MINHSSKQDDPPKLYITISRTGRGLACLELTDPTSKQLLRVPESLADEVVKVMPEVRLAATALNNLAPIGHAYTYSISRPTSSDRLFTDDFVSKLAENLSEEEQHGRFYREKVSSRQVEMQAEDALDWYHLEWCLDFGLHQWTRIVHTTRWRCAVCGGRAELLLPKEEAFQGVLRVLVAADPWRLTSERSYERFERLRGSPSEPEFRIVVDPLLLQGPHPPSETSAEDVILRLGPRVDGSMLVAPVRQQDRLPDWVRVVRAEPRESEDVNGVAHEYAYIPKGDGAQPIELGEVTEIGQLAGKLNKNGRGNLLAKTLLLGHEFGHETLTADPELLQFEDRLANLVMAPPAAAVLLGTFARHADHIPVGAYRITADYFYEDRAFVLVPAISHFIQDAAAGVDKGEVDHRVLRLTGATLNDLVCSPARRMRSDFDSSSGMEVAGRSFITSTISSCWHERSSKDWVRSLQPCTVLQGPTALNRL